MKLGAQVKQEERPPEMTQGAQVKQEERSNQVVVDFQANHHWHPKGNTDFINSNKNNNNTVNTYHQKKVL